MTPLQVFSVSVLRIVKFAGRASVVESLFSKLTGEISAIYVTLLKTLPRALIS